MSEVVISQIEEARASAEAEALARYNQSKQDVVEQSTGQSDEVPEGYNADGTPIEETTEPILGKFQSQEDLVKAYQELEKKLGEQGQKKEEPAETPTNEVKEEAQAVVKNYAEYEQEIATNGKLSDESYAKLEKDGFSREMVDRYVKGQYALAESYTKSIYDFVGSQDDYNTIVGWAADNMDETFITDYNTALQTGNLPKVQQSLEYMAMKLNTSKPSDAKPRRLEGTAAGDAGGMKPFTDKLEWQKATANHLYGKDVKYTNMVDKRYIASKRAGHI